MKYTTELTLATSMIRKHEGLKLTPYKCTAGKLTIGYGHNLERGITREQAECLLNYDIATTIRELDSLSWFRNIKGSTRRAVVIDMCFNLGLPRLLGFQKFIEALEAHNYSTASKEMLDSTRALQVGRRAQYLAVIMKDGEI